MRKSVLLILIHILYGKRKREREGEEKRRLKKGRRVIVKVSVAMIPVRVTGKSEAYILEASTYVHLCII